MKFKVLSRDFCCLKFYLNEVKAKNQQKAWEIVEEEISTNMSQDWLLNEKQFNELKELIK